MGTTRVGAPDTSARSGPDSLPAASRTTTVRRSCYAAFSGSADTLILGRATFDTELGAGRRLFDDTVPTTALRLVDSRAFPNGVVQLRHELRR